MDEFEDMDVQFTLLPGVDLVLWARIVIALVAATAAIALMVLCF